MSPQEGPAVTGGILRAFVAVTLLVPPTARALAAHSPARSSPRVGRGPGRVGNPLIAVQLPIWVAATAMVTGPLPLVVLGLLGFLAVPWTSLRATT